MDSTHLYIKDHTQLFVDNLMIEGTIDLTRRWYRPVRDKQPMIVKDRPWENIPYFTYSNYCVLHDPVDGLFKCWYEDLKLLRTGTLAGRWFGAQQCYAESEDGISWRKPELDVCAVDGRWTNIVAGGDKDGEVHSAYIVLDPHPSRRDERFRMLYTRYPLEGDGSPRIECAHSPDGIHWMVYEERPSFGISGDNLNDVSVIYYDELSRCLVMNTRHYLMYSVNDGLMPKLNGKVFSNWTFPANVSMNNRRRVFQCYSHDFIHWSEPLLIVDVDEDIDNLDSAIYGMAQMKVGTSHLGFAGVLHHVDNTMDIHMLVSHDGLSWQRCYEHQPFLSPGSDGSWERHMVSIVSPPIEVGDEYWFYHGGSMCHHDWWILASAEDLDHPESKDPEAHAAFGLGRAVLRKDGFASLQANRLREGVLVTRGFISDGTKLVINAQCAPGGYIRAEVVDSANNLIPGFELDNSDAFTGDSVAHTMTWKGQDRIPSGDDNLFHRRLRFYLRDAEIFSFRLASE